MEGIVTKYNRKLYRKWKYVILEAKVRKLKKKGKQLLKGSKFKYNFKKGVDIVSERYRYTELKSNFDRSRFFIKVRLLLVMLLKGWLLLWKIRYRKRLKKYMLYKLLINFNFIYGKILQKYDISLRVYLDMFLGKRSFNIKILKLLFKDLNILMNRLFFKLFLRYFKIIWLYILKSRYYCDYINYSYPYVKKGIISLMRRRIRALRYNKIRRRRKVRLIRKKD